MSIKVTEWDDQRSYVHHGEVYNLYFQLSDLPPVEWMELFDEVWRGFFSWNGRRARVEGDYIFTQAPLKEVETLFSKFREAAEKTNVRFAPLQEKQRQFEEVKRQQEEVEAEKKRQIKRRLDGQD